jgi:hypothetical protein
MRKLLLLLSAVIVTASANAQNVATFDTLHLSKPDTFYVNYTNPGNDVGFNDGFAHFPCMYDTSYGGFWSKGFVYSNMTDSATSGYGNLYAAKTAKGYNGSSNYAVVNGNTKIFLQSYALHDTVAGFYITNSTYAYNSMRDGDQFAKKFGGTSGNDSDWFKLTVRGYLNGQLKADSVDFYLADYRFSNNTQDYLVKDWRWVNLMPLGSVDSLVFKLASSDNSQFGMNTPAFFCMDNFTTTATIPASVHETGMLMAKVYPNPVTDNLFIELANNKISEINVIDMSGRSIMKQSVSGDKLTLNTASFVPGAYILQLKGADASATIRFVKQ